MAVSTIKKPSKGNLIGYKMYQSDTEGRYYSINGTLDTSSRYPFIILLAHQSYAPTPVYCVMNRGTLISRDSLVTYSDGVLTVDAGANAWAWWQLLIIQEGLFTPS